MRLIDADALKERAIRVSTVKEHRYLKAVGTHEIDKAHTIDAVPVIRCKDCQSFQADEIAFPDSGVCWHCEMIRRFDDFCSYGKRAEEVV